MDNLHVLLLEGCLIDAAVVSVLFVSLAVITKMLRSCTVLGSCQNCSLS